MPWLILADIRVASSHVVVRTGWATNNSDSSQEIGSNQLPHLQARKQEEVTWNSAGSKNFVELASYSTTTSESRS